MYTLKRNNIQTSVIILQINLIVAYYIIKLLIKYIIK